MQAARFRLALVLALLLLGFARSAGAHPMGNFSISHESVLDLDPGGVRLQYLVDMAEIPTFQELESAAAPADAGDPRLKAILAERSRELAAGLHLWVNGELVSLELVDHGFLFRPGAGDLPTMKIAILLRAAYPRGLSSQAHVIRFEDGNFPGRAGWKEVVVRASGPVRLLRSSAPAVDRSALLTNYPTEPGAAQASETSATASFSLPARPAAAEPVEKAHGIAETSRFPQMPVTAGSHPASTPPTDRRPASVAVQEPAGAIAPLKTNAQSTPRSAFTQIIASQQLDLGVWLLATLIAVGLGALHALEPGHGKTIVAAYVVGSRGTARHALLLGLIVTATHTAGVYLLGLVTLYAQRYVVPEKLFPYLGALSGLLIAGMGAALLLGRLAGEDLLAHSHDGSGAEHSHGLFRHAHLPSPSRTPEGERLQLRQLLILGITGGIVPCPAALVVLLSAVALHRLLFGMVLIVAFSLGLAIVLIALGIAAVYARDRLTRMRSEGRYRQGAWLERWLPLTSAALMTLLGVAVTLQSVWNAGLIRLHG